MNPFHIVCNAAKEGRLPVSENAHYYASAKFRERVNFRGAEGVTDQLEILHHMLRHVALDPRHARGVQEYLAAGIVCLQFYGVSNPVPFLQLPIGSTELDRMAQAVNANLGRGPLSKAAARVARRRLNSARRSAQEDKVLGRLRNSLPWPGPTEFKANPEKARDAQRALVDILDNKRIQLRDRHQTRAAALSRGVMRGATSWTELVTKIALDALQPN